MGIADAQHYGCKFVGIYFFPLTLKTSKPYDTKIVGIVSSATPIAFASTRSIALTGRVPIKVSTQNGPIQPGDYLTSSDIPGVAMKATAPGPVVGKALQAFPANDQFSSTNLQSNSNNQISNCGNGYQCGKVLVFVNVGFADPEGALANLLTNGQFSNTNLQSSSNSQMSNLLASIPTLTTGFVLFSAFSDLQTNLQRLGLSIQNGIFTVQQIVADRITGNEVDTRKLCVDDVCVTKDQLKKMLEQSGQLPASNGSSVGPSDSSAAASASAAAPAVTSAPATDS